MMMMSSGLPFVEIGEAALCNSRFALIGNVTRVGQADADADARPR